MKKPVLSLILLIVTIICGLAIFYFNIEGALGTVTLYAVIVSTLWGSLLGLLKPYDKASMIIASIQAVVFICILWFLILA